MDYEDPCVQYARDLADNEAEEKYTAYIDSLKNGFIDEYNKKCIGQSIEQFYLKYQSSDYHFTLYYYDQAGNLVRTVPPEGVNVEINQTNLDAIKQNRRANLAYANKTYYTSHKLQTTYTYNSLNQLIKQETPDAGISHFWYDKLGRLVLSQNSKQAGTMEDLSTNYYSYTKYDPLGRICEVGQIGLRYNVLSLDELTLKNLLNPVTDNYPENIAYWQKTEVTKTYYGDDQNFTPLVAGNNFTNGSQEYLRSRVASVTIENIDDNNSSTYAHATHYSYDVHGNVKELIQENKNMPVTNQRLKKINYNYDLISGKVNEVAYQKNQPDMFLHRYEYDADNRITNVYTSRNNIIWDQDAKYFYYLHGPLARVELGQHKVQALDYAYTIQGWIKGINSNLLNADYDIGKDGVGVLTNPTSGGTSAQVVNKFNARDAFGYSLTYFNNTSYKDYLAINGSSQSNATSFTGTEPTSGTTPDLYNGNIRQMVTSYLDASAPNKTYGLKSLLRNYTYDQLNRITSANSNDNLNTTTNTWGSPSITGLYAETFTYDQNGNILTLNRKGNLSGSQQHMDDLKYHYIANTNKLDYVTDLVTANNYSVDIKNGQTSGNYQYDAIGNLTKDEQEHISDIKWTVYGKIKKITKSSGNISEINFDYDASGNRISKNVVYDNGNSNTIYYIRDAQGNTMATYENNIVPSTSNTYSLTEHHIYGSSRLGMNINKIDPRVVLSNGNYFTRNVDQISYELSNHLGNVVATVNAKKIAVENSNDNVVDYFSSEILSGTDYYSFGSPMPGRQFSAGSPYKYGFNGKENDPETVETGSGTQDYGFRIYNPNLGKFLSVDPLTSKYPHYSPYHFAGNTPIIAIDLDGGEDQWIHFKENNDGTYTEIINQFEVDNLTRQANIKMFGKMPNTGVVYTFEHIDGSRKVRKVGETIAIKEYKENLFLRAIKKIDNFVRSSGSKKAFDENSSYEGDDGMRKGAEVLDNTGTIMKATVVLAPIGEGLSIMSDILNTIQDFKNKEIGTAIDNTIVRALTFGSGKVLDKAVEGVKGVSKTTKEAVKIVNDRAIDKVKSDAIDNK